MEFDYVKLVEVELLCLNKKRGASSLPPEVPLALLAILKSYLSHFSKGVCSNKQNTYPLPMLKYSSSIPWVQVAP